MSAPSDTPHEVNDPNAMRRRPPPPTTGSDNKPPKPDMHPTPGGFHPPPVNHPSWPHPGPGPGQYHPRPDPHPGPYHPPGPYNGPFHRPNWRPRPGQFRPRPLHRPVIAWLPLNNIPSWLCNYVAQIYNIDPGCCDEAFARSRNISNFEVENCVWCGRPDC